MRSGSAFRRSCFLLVLLLVHVAGCGKSSTGPALPDLKLSSEIAPASSGPSDPSRCAKGRIAGLWIKNDGSEQDGRIEAAWIGGRGDTLGMVSGTFWRSDGQDSLPGFEATVSGRVLSVVLFEISGTWSFNDPRMCPECGSSRGLYMGRWLDPRTGRRGRLSGEWGDLPIPFSERKMPLSGRWSAPCSASDRPVVADRPY